VLEAFAREAVGTDVGHLHVPTLKPFDAEALLEFCEGRSRVVTVENHSIIGGLGSAVAEVLAEAGVGARLTRLGVPDVWAPGGSIGFVRKQLGLDAVGLADRLGSLDTGARERA
jgi:transketolase